MALTSDPALLDAFRKQVRTIKRNCPDEPAAPYSALLVWKGQRGISQDDMIDILHEECDGAPAEPYASGL